jgi:RIO kinase 1
VTDDLADPADLADLHFDRWDREYGEEDRTDRYSPPKPRLKAPPLLEPETTAAECSMTYKPSRFEAGWLASSLGPFFQERLITDVLYHVKGGKEASVYCCRGPEDLGVPLVAAKVYRPRQFRQLRNDKMYREGRPILTAGGRPAKKTDHRLLRAVGKKTDFGVQVEHTSWLMHEYTTLEKLHKAGAAVPKPIGASDNAILMEYRGDINSPAPPLSHIRLDESESEPLFREAVRNIALMLEMNLIHGDLSAYNILYWEGAITLIDFPQVSDSQSNRNAEFILRRDITRICEYFSDQGASCDPDRLMDRLWRAPDNPDIDIGRPPE